jgi:hypothetical protein
MDQRAAPYLIAILLLLGSPLISALKMEPYAKVFLDRISYGPGSVVYASIFDRNFNMDDEVIEALDLTQVVRGKPIVEVRIVQPTKGTIVLSALDGSMKDSSGRSVTEALESGPNTSLFEFVIQLPDDIEVNSSIAVLYEDPFELSPTTREEIPVKRKIELRDTLIAGVPAQHMNEIGAGQEVVISSTVYSTLSSSQSYVYIVQVKNSEGITVMLSWISGKVEPQRHANAAVAWNTEELGTYTIEIFLWQDILKPVPLLKQETSTIVVK